MKRNGYLKDLVENIKKTDEMIVLHKNAGTPALMLEQYEAINVRQISELIESLNLPPYKNMEGFLVIKDILNKFYPELSSDLIKHQELRELEESIS